MRFKKEKIEVTKEQFECMHPKGFSYRSNRCNTCGLKMQSDLQVKRGFATLVVKDENTNQNEKQKQNS